MVGPGSSALAVGEVWHARNRPRNHEFTYPISQIWIDPDRPEELFGRHPLWSADRPRPIRFRRRDYFDGGAEPIGPALRSAVAEALGHRPTGPIRMLTQPRTWGWLFNPITVYLLWDDGAHDHESALPPTAAVLEVTNTPWKERVLYRAVLRPDGDRMTAWFDKRLHVSPFLGEDFVYRLSVGATTEPAATTAPHDLAMAIDVHRAEPDADADTHVDAGPPADADTHVDDGRNGATSSTPLLKTRLMLRLLAPTRRTMNAALYRHPLPTHRVSLGIHVQATKLWRKGVPFVSHPKRSPEMSRP